MDWDQLGFYLGSVLGQSWEQNRHARRLEKGRNVLNGMGAVNEDDTQNARGLFNSQFSESPYLGQNPEMIQLGLSKDYMQAQNDAQYLLNNGYDENSEEVRGFRQKMADAHNQAENLRKVATGAGFGDIGKVSAGLSLQELKDKINHVVAPGLYNPQQFDIGKALADKHAWAGQTAQNILAGQQDSQNAQPGQFQLGGAQGLQGMSPGAQHARKFTEADLYKILQDEGYAPKDVSYEDQINALARQIAQKRVASMNRNDVMSYLRGQGVGRGVAGELADEYVQNAQAQMRKETLARAAAASPNDQMAALIAMAAATPGAKLSDITGFINATNPQMKLNTIDTGGAISALYGDERGRVPMTQTTLQKMLSPKDIAESQYRYDALKQDADKFNAQQGWRYYDTDTRNNTSLRREQMRGQNAIDAIDRRGQWNQLLDRGGSRGDGEGGLKQSEEKTANIILNGLDKLEAAFSGDQYDSAYAGDILDEVTTQLSKMAEKGDIDPKTWTELIYPRLQRYHEARQIAAGYDPNVLDATFGQQEE
jgi:hypothetical protein